MKINLEKYEYYCSEKEIGFLIDRFDLNRDGRVSRSEFIQELTPKLNQEI
jgi:Ca2+-binding EF-hand superfamily protein